MKPEQLVPSLETCKKLKDFPETYFNYLYNESMGEYVLGNRDMFLDNENKKNLIPAPTVAELMDVLPEIIKDDYGLKLFKGERDYVATYYDAFLDIPFLIFASTNPAEALALLYIELKEKGVI